VGSLVEVIVDLIARAREEEEQARDGNGGKAETWGILFGCLISPR